MKMFRQVALFIFKTNNWSYLVQKGHNSSL